MRPVFVGGCERSGTTMLGSMLAAPPDHIGIPEMQFKTELLASSDYGKKDLDASQGRYFLLDRARFQALWEMDPLLASHLSGRMSLRELLETIVKLYALKEGNDHTATWIDHSPSNVRLAATLFEVFPDAGFIHIVRDGRAVAASVIPLDWGPNDVVEAARWWMQSLSHGLAAETSYPPERLQRIHYEDLVTEPTVTLQRVCSNLRIPFREEMTTGIGFRVPSYTALQHSLVGNEPDASRVSTWETELSSREIEIFEGMTGDLLRLLGYELKYGIHASPVTRRERYAWAAQDFYKRRVNRQRMRNRTRRSLRSLHSL